MVNSILSRALASVLLESSMTKNRVNAEKPCEKYALIFSLAGFSTKTCLHYRQPRTQRWANFGQHGVGISPVPALLGWRWFLKRRGIEKQHAACLLGVQQKRAVKKRHAATAWRAPRSRAGAGRARQYSDL